MTGRWLWALLLIATVFSVHGIQCMATGSAAGHVAVGDGITTTAVLETDAHQTGVDAAARGYSAAMGTAAAVVHDVGGSIVNALPVDQGPGPGGHLLAVCLVVLVGGLLFLRAVKCLRRGAVTTVRGLPPRLLGTWVGSFAVRPPDLFALCLLRI